MNELKEMAVDLARITTEFMGKQIETEDANLKALIISMATVVLTEINEVRLQNSELSPELENALREVRLVARAIGAQQ